MKYGVILADPPWRYTTGKGVRGSAAAQYPTMSIIEICNLPVEQFSDDDCVLLLWTTWPLLFDSHSVVDAWGFKYVTGMPWIKINGIPRLDLFGEMDIKSSWGVGYWFRGVTEPILVCRKGNPKRPTEQWAGLMSPNIKHSRKPLSIYDFAESLDGPYLELFARRKRKGWHVWGNEVEGDVDIQNSR